MNADGRVVGDRRNAADKGRTHLLIGAAKPAGQGGAEIIDRLGGGARYVGDRPGDAANSFVPPAYTVADVFATYETKVQSFPVIYQFNVKNLFDTVYYPSANSILTVAMGDARRFSHSATVKF